MNYFFCVCIEAVDIDTCYSK